MPSLDILQREHRLVVLVADAARDGLFRERVDVQAPLIEIDRFIDFFRCYGAACADSREEDLLLAALHRRGVSWHSYPLSALLETRQALRRALDAAVDALALAWAGDEESVRPALDRLDEYLELMARHVEMEEEILLPMARVWLTAADLMDLELGEAGEDEVDAEARGYYAALAYDLAGIGTSADRPRSLLSGPPGSV